ncbi:MAG: phytoene synthase [bacterium]|jgi:phytoene synthase
MKHLFDEISNKTAVGVTKKYSTSFSMAVALIDKSIRQDIYNVYGFVRIADEIVDSLEDYPQEELLDRFEEELWYALKHGISSNLIINAFQCTVKKYDIPHTLISAFLKSMRADLTKKVYAHQDEIDEYIYGSADVVGLMCLKIFVKGDEVEYNLLQDSATKLGSAFQKVNFLRDLKQDFEDLDRSYFPNLDPADFSEIEKDQVIAEIAEDFRIAKKGINLLPKEARLGVYLAYKYYSVLLKKITKTPAHVLAENRIRVSNFKKIRLLIQAHMKYKLNMI